MQPLALASYMPEAEMREAASGRADRAVQPALREAMRDPALPEAARQRVRSGLVGRMVRSKQEAARLGLRIRLTEGPRQADDERRLWLEQAGWTQGEVTRLTAEEERDLFGFV